MLASDNLNGREAIMQSIVDHASAYFPLIFNDLYWSFFKLGHSQASFSLFCLFYLKVQLVHNTLPLLGFKPLYQLSPICIGL